MHLTSFQAHNPHGNLLGRYYYYHFTGGSAIEATERSTHSPDVTQQVPAQSRLECGSGAAHHDRSTWPRPVPGIWGGNTFDYKPGWGTSQFALEATFACQEAMDRSTILLGATRTATRKVTHKFKTERWLPLWIPSYFTSLP